MVLHSSPLPPEIRVRRASQYELQHIFPTLSNNRVGSTLSTSPPSSQIPITRQNFEVGQRGQLTESSAFRFRSKRSFRKWCAVITAGTALILLSGIVATIIILLLKPPVVTTITTTTVTTATTTSVTTTTSTTSTSTTTSTTTTSTTSTSSTSSSTSTSSTSTSSTSSTSSSTSTTDTTSSTSSTTSDTTSTSTTSTTSTTQNPRIGSLNGTSATYNAWTQFTHFYTAANTGTATLYFTMEIDNQCSWFLDDVSILSPTSVEMLTNGHFDSSSSPTGWTRGSGSCGSFGITNTRSRSSHNSICLDCNNQMGLISQSFSINNGDVYNFNFWYYFTCGGSTTTNPVNYMIIDIH